MYKLSQSYSSMMPSWIRNCFFNPELERHRLSSHQYCQHDSVRTMRQMQDVHLVDFVELNLKSNDDFDAAFDIVLSTNLLEYLKHFLRSQPGDCTASPRQVRRMSRSVNLPWSKRAWRDLKHFNMNPNFTYFLWTISDTNILFLKNSCPFFVGYACRF